MLRLSLFGVPDLRRPGEDPPLSVLTGPKRLALLAYLALQGPDVRCRRDTLLALFWPEADSTSARRSLRNMLYELRQALGDGVLSGRRREELAIDAEKLWCDVWAFEDALARGAWEEALELYRGELLAGYHVSGASPELEQWLDRKRAELHRRAVDAAWRLSRRAEARDRADEAVRWARRAVGLAPKDGQGGRRLVELLVRLGRPVAALRAFDALARQLRNELGVDPPPDLKERVQELRASLAPEDPDPQASGPPIPPEISSPPALERPGTESSGDAARSLGLPQIRMAVGALLLVLGLAAVGLYYWDGRSGGLDGDAAAAASLEIGDMKSTLAVLPFENLGPDTMSYFAAGLHEEVLTRLASVSGFRVLSRTSVGRYEGTRKTVREIGQELGATAILEGSVRHAGARIRITAQLVDAETGVHLWAEDFDRSLSVPALLDIQTALAERIASALEAELQPQERERIARLPTRDLGAYDAYLEGRHHWGRFLGTRALPHVSQSVGALRQATRRDPDFGEAHAWLGLAYATGHWVSPERRWLDSAYQSLERADGLEGDLASLHLARAVIRFGADSMDAAEAALRATVRLEPSNVVAHSLLASVENAQGDLVNAVARAHQAVRLDPRNPLSLQAMGYMLKEAGLLHASEAWFRRALAIDPQYFLAVWNLADIYRYRGRPEEALRTIEEVLHNDPDHYSALVRAGRIALAVDRPRLARSYLLKAEEARRRVLSRRSAPQSRGAGLSLENRIYLGLAEVRIGNGDRGRALLHEVSDALRRWVEDDSQDSHGDLIDLARALAALGETEAALERFEQWTRRRKFNPDAYRTDPLLASLLTEPRFRQLLDRREQQVKVIRASIQRLDISLYPPTAAHSQTS